MLILVSILYLFLFAKNTYAQNLDNSQNFKIEEADSSLTCFTVKSFNGNRLVAEKNYCNDFLASEIFISNDTVFFLQYYSNSKVIEFKTLFCFPHDSLLQFIGFDNESYWNNYRFQEEGYDSKGRLEVLNIHKKSIDPYSSQYRYIDDYMEVFKNGKRKECFTWKYTGPTTLESVPAKCR